MFTASALEAVQETQVALTLLTALELTGYLCPPPALLRDGDMFDYIVVGGGSSGCVIANRLVRKKFSVLLIEAGIDPPFETTLPGLSNYIPSSRIDWNYTTENDGYSYQYRKDNVNHLGLGKMLGGSSEANCFMYSRGNPYDFKEWAKAANDSSWNWKNVLKYYKKAENVTDSAIRNSKFASRYGTKGRIGVTRENDPATGEILEGFRQIGRDIIDDIDGNRVGYSRPLLTIKDGFRQGSAVRYLSQISENRYIATAKNTTATKIIFDKDKMATSVEVITDEGKKITVHVKIEIILATGAIKTPQLLMLSGIGPKKDLKKLNIKTISNLPVGHNLQDHVGTLVFHRTNKPQNKKPRDPGLYPTALFIGYGSLKEKDNHKTFPDYKVIGHLMPNNKYLAQFCAHLFKFPVPMCDKLYDEAKNKQVLATFIAGLYARSRGQVKLRSADPLDPPLVLSGAFSHPQDQVDLAEYTHDFLKVEKSAAFKKLGISKIDLTKPRCNSYALWSKEYCNCYNLVMMVSYKSLGGTCSMGRVVDNRLRVKGVSGLRVADASIMPRIVSGLLYNTVLMIAEKAADIIIEDAGAYADIEHSEIRPDQIKNMP